MCWHLFVIITPLIAYTQLLRRPRWQAMSNFRNRPGTSSLCSLAAGSAKNSLSELTFDNRNLMRLPLDPITSNNDVRQVAGAIFSRVPLQPVRNPRVVAVSPSALALLGVALRRSEGDGVITSACEAASAMETDPNYADEQSRLWGEVRLFLSGSEQISGSDLAAHCYCGHQFGQFAGQLGDGCAMYLGEVPSSDASLSSAMGIAAPDSDPFNSGPIAAHGGRWELQLKGSGKTPYSRRADGRKVLRSSIREFLGSEALYYLGIPTTRR
jgi:hypothetical protein